MLLQGADPDDPKTQVLEKIERQTFRAAKIVNGLLNLARPGRSTAGRGPQRRHQRRALAARAPDALRQHPGTEELSATAPIVQGIEYKLQQVFLNLLLNARDAMPKGGWLTIVTCQGASEASVEIGDTGSGIPAEQLSRIYDPFFTTKDIAKGQGSGCDYLRNRPGARASDYVPQLSRAGHALQPDTATRLSRQQAGRSS